MSDRSRRLDARRTVRCSWVGAPSHLGELPLGAVRPVPVRASDGKARAFINSDCPVVEGRDGESEDLRSEVVAREIQTGLDERQAEAASSQRGMKTETDFNVLFLWRLVLEEANNGAFCVRHGEVSVRAGIRV